MGRNPARLLSDNQVMFCRRSRVNRGQSSDTVSIAKSIRVSGSTPRGGISAPCCCGCCCCCCGGVGCWSGVIWIDPAVDIAVPPLVVAAPQVAFTIERPSMAFSSLSSTRVLYALPLLPLLSAIDPHCRQACPGSQVGIEGNSVKSFSNAP